LEFRPITGIFAYHSTEVWKVALESGDTLGVTFQHPIYTRSGWTAAGLLEAGDEVLTYSGFVPVAAVSRHVGLYPVYNLEVKDLHNFLVENVGVVVHNTGLFDNVVKEWINKYFPKVGTNNMKPPGTKHPISNNKVKQKYGKTQICYDDLGFPDFSPFVEKFTNPVTGQLIEAAFEIDMAGNYSSDYTKANDALRALTGDTNMPNFTNSIGDIEYTWHHHQDGKTMMLVPKAVNNPNYGGAPHVGGKALKKHGMAGDNSILPSYKESKGKFLSKCK